jgi:hypothetical protein
MRNRNHCVSQWQNCFLKDFNIAWMAMEEKGERVPEIAGGAHGTATARPIH